MYMAGVSKNLRKILANLKFLLAQHTFSISRGDEQCSGQVLGVCVSPSGQLVAALNDRKAVCVWSAADGRVVGSWQTARKASCLTFTRDELSLLVAGG